MQLRRYIPILKCGLFALLSTTAAAEAQSEAPGERLRRLAKERIIPTFVDYEPPEEFVHSDTRVVGFMSATPSARWFGAISFKLVPVGLVLAADKTVRSVPLTWNDLKRIAQNLPSPLWIKPELSEVTIDGRRVLVVDFEKLGGSPSAIPARYGCRFWIPIEKDVVLEVSIGATTPDLKATLKKSVSSMRIKRYHPIE
jgi:hypothetical protein